jgi:hypothetical protein
MAAFWGKMVGGMAAMDVNWVLLVGLVPDGQVIAERFSDANSLNTLLLLVEPFATTSNAMLFNLLQIIGWAIAGGFVGALSTRQWVKHTAPWSVLVVTAGGGLILLATHVALPYWLQEVSPPPAYVDPAAPLLALIVVILVGTVFYSVRESLDLPVAPKRRWWERKQNRARPRFRFFPEPALHGSTPDIRSPVANGPRGPVRVPSQSELPEWEPPQSDSGLIMLEID